VAKAAHWPVSDAVARKAWGSNRIRYPGSPRRKTMSARRRHACMSVPQLTREALRLGVRSQDLKLKGIDGGPHKRWSMWFNSTQRAEPYQPLTSRDRLREWVFPQGATETGAAWLSSSSCREMLVKSRNERPLPQLPHLVGHSEGLAHPSECDEQSHEKLKWALELHYVGGLNPTSHDTS